MNRFHHLDKIVLKFGGSSLSNDLMFTQSLHIAKQANLNKHVYIIVSALGGVTNALLDLCEKASNGDYWKNILIDLRTRHKDQFMPSKSNSSPVFVDELCDDLENELIRIEAKKEYSLKDLDSILSYGERLSVRLFVSGLEALDVNASYRETHYLVKTDSNFGEAKVDLELSAKNIRQAVEYTNEVIVFTGFIGSDKNGTITTLGRSGSDFTAGLVGYSIDAKRVEIWTDVDGVFSTDPNVLNSAIVMSRISYQFMELMADNGAKVLHPRTVRPLQIKKIPIQIKNTFSPELEGTLVSSIPKDSDEKHAVSLKKELWFISNEALGKVRLKLSEDEHDFLERFGIQVQNLESVAGICIPESIKKHHNYYTLNEKIHESEWKPCSQVILMSSNYLETDHIHLIYDILVEEGISVVGSLSESEHLLSFFIPQKEQLKALEIVHKEFCVQSLVD